MPLRIMVGCGTVRSQRKAQAGMLSSGRRERMPASVSSSKAASFPPRTGSMTQTGMPRSRRISTLRFASCNVQST